MTDTEFVPTPDNPLYRVGTVAAMFDVDPAQVRDWIKEGRIEARKILGQWRISKSEVARFTNEEYGNG